MSDKAQKELKVDRTDTVHGFGVSKSHFISELLHEVVENLVVTLDRGLCFVEDMLAKLRPVKRY
jgi:hypothetical protein